MLVLFVDLLLWVFPLVIVCGFLVVVLICLYWFVVVVVDFVVRLNVWFLIVYNCVCWFTLCLVLMLIYVNLVACHDWGFICC